MSRSLTLPQGGLSLPTSSYLKALDDEFYNPDEEAKAFFKAETGIQDDDELREHIIAVQSRAFAVCID